MQSKYDCPYCEGTGWRECESCGNEICCEECDGTGLDDEKIDTVAFTMAEGDLISNGMTWSLFEGDELIGREGNGGRLLYADFARDRPEESTQNPP